MRFELFIPNIIYYGTKFSSVDFVALHERVDPKPSKGHDHPWGRTPGENLSWTDDPELAGE